MGILWFGSSFIRLLTVSKGKGVFSQKFRFLRNNSYNRTHDAIKYLNDVSVRNRPDGIVYKNPCAI